MLAGRDSLVVLPTGGGKSLCFQAPALVRDGLAIVVSPLISLMKDQVDTLVGNGVPAACYNSALAAGPEGATSRAACATAASACSTSRRSGWSATAATASSTLLGRRPRQLRRHRRGALHQPVGPRLPAGVPAARRSCASAGRGQPARLHRHRDRARAPRHRRAARPARCRSSWSARSIGRTSSIACSRASTLKKQMQDVLARHRGEAGIIYCPSRKEVDALAAWLRETGVRAVPYHAGLADEERHRNQDAFLNEDVDVVVATVAFGMGIDRSDVRFVDPRRRAAVARALPAGIGPRRPRRPRGRVRADLLGRRLPEVAGDARAERRAVRRAAHAAARHGALRGERRLPAQAAGRLLRRDATTKDDCGACDYCLGELEPVADAGHARAQDPLGVARVGQRFGAAHVTNVLRGSDSELVTLARPSRAVASSGC